MQKSRSLTLSAGSVLAATAALTLLAAPAQAAERVAGAGTGTLPQTGGSGMSMFFIIGGGLVLLAVIAFLVRFMRQRGAGGDGGGGAGADAGGVGAAGVAGAAGDDHGRDDSGSGSWGDSSGGESGGGDSGGGGGDSGS